MEKLSFYSLSSPEKLDRIGEYLFQRASRDIYRYNINNLIDRKLCIINLIIIKSANSRCYCKLLFTYVMQNSRTSNYMLQANYHAKYNLAIKIP